MRLPEQKDVVVVELHSGREYGGYSASTGNVRRHMVVMSSSSYTRATGMILVVPITPRCGIRLILGIYQSY